MLSFKLPIFRTDILSSQYSAARTCSKRRGHGCPVSLCRGSLVVRSGPLRATPVFPHHLLQSSRSGDADPLAALYTRDIARDGKHFSYPSAHLSWLERCPGAWSV